MNLLYYILNWCHETLNHKEKVEIFKYIKFEEDEENFTDYWEKDGIMVANDWFRREIRVHLDEKIETYYYDHLELEFPFIHEYYNWYIDGRVKDDEDSN
jgi:hypothetical protein